jgi:hypothetical protein
LFNPKSERPLQELYFLSIAVVPVPDPTKKLKQVKKKNFSGNMNVTRIVYTISIIK